MGVWISDKSNAPFHHPLSSVGGADSYHGPNWMLCACYSGQPAVCGQALHALWHGRQFGDQFIEFHGRNEGYISAFIQGIT